MICIFLNFRIIPIKKFKSEIFNAKSMIFEAESGISEAKSRKFEAIYTEPGPPSFEKAQITPR